MKGIIHRVQMAAGKVKSARVWERATQLNPIGPVDTWATANSQRAMGRRSALQYYSRKMHYLGNAQIRRGDQISLLQRCGKPFRSWTKKK